jgi:hypothetical protein
MKVKDYYTILELPSSATQQEIKKAYHRLALLYHPDKNNNDPYAAALFTGIKEAYEVLTNPAKKEYYLQQRWYAQSIGRRKKQELITPVSLLKQVLELDRHVSTLDIHRLDKEGLYAYISALIPGDTIEILNTFSDMAINREITLALLNCSRALPLNLVVLLIEQLNQIKNDPATKERISMAMQNHQRAHREEKYRIWIVLLIVALLSLLIFLMSR